MSIDKCRELFYFRIKIYNSMKKIFLISSIVASTLGMVNAQVKQTAAPVKTEIQPEARAKDRVAEINRICNLKPEQVTKVNDLYVDFFKKEQALKAKQLPIEEVRKQLADLKGQRDAAMKAALTPEQIGMLQKSRTSGAAKPAGQ
jgi:hypothetical protein